MVKMKAPKKQHGTPNLAFDDVEIQNMIKEKFTISLNIDRHGETSNEHSVNKVGTSNNQDGIKTGTSNNEDRIKTGTSNKHDDRKAGTSNENTECELGNPNFSEFQRETENTLLNSNTDRENNFENLKLQLTENNYRQLEEESEKCKLPNDKVVPEGKSDTQQTDLDVGKENDLPETQLKIPKQETDVDLSQPITFTAKKESAKYRIAQNGDDNKQNTEQDGRRKWIVLVAGFLTFVMANGFPFNMAVLYVEWLDEFGQSNSETSLVQSVCTGIFFVGGFISGFVVTKFGAKKSGIIAGIMVIVGLVASFFATTITHLVLSLGVVSGLGFSMSYVTASTCVGKQFEGKMKIMALAIISCGSGVGATIFPITLETLIQEYGWRGALLITAGIMCHLVLNGGIFDGDGNTSKGPKCDEATDRETDRKGKVSCIEHEKEKTENRPEDFKSNGESVNNQKNNASISSQASLRRVSFSTTSIRKLFEEKEGKEGGLYNILQETVFNKVFILHTLAIAISLPAFNTTLIFFVDYFQSKGLSRDDAVNIYMYMNIVSTTFRLFPGFFKQLPHVSVVLIPVMGTFIGGISLIGFTFAGSSVSLNIAAAAGFGISIGCMVTTLGVSIIKIVGQRNYSAGLGISMTCIGLCTVSAGPLSGYIRDVTGNYNTSLYASASIMFLSSILFFCTMVYRHYLNRDKGSRFDFEMVIRRKSRRRSSLFPWRRKSVAFSTDL